MPPKKTPLPLRDGNNNVFAAKANDDSASAASIVGRRSVPGWLKVLVSTAFLLTFLFAPRVSTHLWISQQSFEARALKILAENPLIDGHNDLAIMIRNRYGNHINYPNFTHPFQDGNLPMHVDMPRMDKGKYGGAFWSLFLPCPADISDFSTRNYDPTVRATLAQLDLIHRLAIRYPKYFSATKSAAEAKKHFSQGKLIAPYAIEGLHQIGNSFSNLRLYHQLGVRYATLTWNCHNAFADAAVLTHAHNDSSIRAPPHWSGASLAGRQLIVEMNRLGMMVDLSHVSELTMRDVLVGEHNASNIQEAWSGSIAPPIFSHSSAHALCPHPRNVPDSVLQLVKQRNSLVMVNFLPDFISCTAPPPGAAAGALPDFYPPNSTLKQVVRHIMHIGDLIGYDHVGIGTDYDGMDTTPRGLEDVSKFPDLVAELLRQGVSEKNAAKVVGRNLLRVWAEVDKVSETMQKNGALPAEDDISR